MEWSGPCKNVAPLMGVRGGEGGERRGGKGGEGRRERVKDGRIGWSEVCRWGIKGKGNGVEAGEGRKGKRKGGKRGEERGGEQ